MQGMRKLPHENRLKHLILHSLERQRLQCELIKGFHKGDVNMILVVKELGRTCINGFKLDKLCFSDSKPTLLKLLTQHRQAVALPREPLRLTNSHPSHCLAGSHPAVFCPLL